MNFSRRMVVPSLLTAAFFLGMTPAALSQTNRGTISGSVLDPHGAAVPRASVVITNEGTNQSITLKTSERGSYSSPQVDPVTYRITVSAPGFRSEVVNAVKVDTSSVTTIDIHLEVGQTKDTLTINAEAPLINGDQTAAGTTLTQQEIEAMPIGQRQVLDLILTLPNVTGVNQPDVVSVFQNTLAPGVGYNINGSRPGETSFLADGVNNTGVGFNRAVVTFSPDAVQEFTVLTSNFSAEYGSSGGGVVNFTTKSGTNQFHGSAAWFTVNPFFNAATYSTSTRIPPQARENDGIMTFGGPVWIPKIYNGRNKTFFFIDAEPKWHTDGVGVTTITAPDSWRQGNFSDLVSVNGTYVPLAAAQQLKLNYTPVVIYNQFGMSGNQLTMLPAPAAGQTYTPFPNNTIPQSMLDSVSQKIIQQGMPPAGSWFLNGSTPQNYAYIRGVRTHVTPLTFRVDERVTDKNSLYGRYTTVPNYGVRSRGFFAGSDVNQYQTDFSASKQILIGDTHIFSSTVVNDLKMNYLRGNYNTTNSPDWQTNNWSTQLGLPALTAGGLPQFNFSSQGLFTIGQNSIQNINFRVEEGYNVTDTLTWIHRNMSFKFGGDLRRSLQKIISQSYASSGNYRFQSSLTNSSPSGGTGGADFATFLLGVPNNVTLFNSYLPYYYRWNAGNWFAQNDWKVRPNLTVNVGIRYSLDLPRTEKNNLQAFYNPDQTMTVALPQQLFNTNGTPYTALPAGLLPATTQVPTLEWAGRGGNSKYLYQPDYKEFQPRFGFAWKPKLFGLNSGWRDVLVRGGYGLSYQPLTGTNIAPSPNFGATAPSYGENTGQVNSNYVLRLSSNPPNLMATNPTLNIPANGKETTDTLAYQASVNVIPQNFKVPYSQTWSLAVQTSLLRDTVLEVGYSGNKGTHLFFPPLNLNSLPFSASQSLSQLNVSLTSTIRDPLGRYVTPGVPSSGIISVPVASVLEPYAGFTALYNQYEPYGDSIHHAGYVSVQRRMSHGLMFRSTFTYQKTLTDASETGVNCTPCGNGSRIWTQVSYGASYQQERAVATFNQPWVWVSTFAYQLPIGKGKGFLGHSNRLLDGVVGGWMISGIGTVQSGLPGVVTLFDTNGLSSLTQGSGNGAVRPNIVPGVPLVNPNWSSSCLYGTACAPYLNPGAFERPALGQIGNAPAALNVYAPMQRNLDIAVTKTFRFGESSKRYLQLKLDAINVFNYAGVSFGSTNSFNGAWLVKSPSFTSDLSTTNYVSWANGWNAAHPGDQVPTAITNNPTLTSIQNLTAVPRAGNSGVLPNNFFSIPLTSTFGLTNPNTYDIRTLQGLKLYDLYQAGFNTSFGQLSYYNNNNARLLQIQVKVVF
jgi:outer membrane receptor protein involved in Fe transport